MKHTLGCIDSVCPEVNKVIEDVITIPTSARSVEEKFTLTELNMGKNLGVRDLIPEFVKTASTSKATNSVEKTLVDSNITTHASNPTIN